LFFLVLWFNKQTRWATKEARERLIVITVNNLSAFITGNPVVNK
jgi:lactate dehydrogenase-like 2-hydroxyacid dehydrogenase